MSAAGSHPKVLFPYDAAQSFRRERSMRHTLPYTPYTFYQQLWTSYRSTAEPLKHKKYLFLGRAAPYNGEGDQFPLLAERVEALAACQELRGAAVASPRCSRSLLTQG